MKRKASDVWTYVFGCLLTVLVLWSCLRPRSPEELRREARDRFKESLREAAEEDPHDNGPAKAPLP